MNRIETIFLSILRSALAGERIENVPDMTAEDWNQILQLSQVHNVTPLVYETVYQVPALKNGSVPAFVLMKQTVMHQVMMQAVKTDEFLRLYRHLQKAGVKPMLVKGAICRSLYPQPDHRPSGDEDVLVMPEQFNLAREAMASFGMETNAAPRQQETDYEVPYGKIGSPIYVELHRHLFPPESEAYGAWNRYFDGVFDSAMTVEIEGVPVYTMAPTENMFYLICHSFKHFLHSGFGIRQVCDIILFANRYGSRINWQRVLTLCKAIRAEKFTAALFQIGQKYLVFNPVQACYPSVWQNIRVNEGPMLEDLLSGGLYGDATMSRKHSSNMTLDAVAAANKGKKAGSGVMGSLFPSAKKLEGRYEYLRERPYLLPVAWAERIVKYGKETRKNQTNNAADTVRIGNRRIELMKQYGIIK